jgi:putative nucleotidyltransferase with HDIG domain
MSDDVDVEIRRRLQEQVAQGSLELPVLPEVAGQVMAATSSENCDARALTELLRRDQALAAHLLRLANSPLYLPRTPIVSLQQAVSRLGLMTIRQIALVISCQSRAFAVKGHEPLVRALFRHSLAAAVFAQEVARIRRLNVEDAFLCGLLHDVGKPVLLQAIVDLEQQLRGRLSPLQLATLLNELHQQAGESLVRAWKLSPRMAETILFHHRPTEAPEPSAQAAALLSLADDLAHLLVGPRKTEDAVIKKHPMLARLNIYPDELDGLLARRPEILRMVEAIG